MKKILTFAFITAFLLAAVLMAAGCTTQSNASPNKGTITVTDLTNRTVQVTTDPQRIVGVGAGALRMISYLSGDRSRCRGRRP